MLKSNLDQFSPINPLSRHVRRVIRDVELCHGVELVRPVLPRWRPHTLQGLPESPPVPVEVPVLHPALKDVLAPGVYHQAPGDQRDAVQGLAEEVVDTLCTERNRLVSILISI